jgi:Arc/MetJ-type ribon-helix-helix transcriptional regulator
MVELDAASAELARRLVAEGRYESVEQAVACGLSLAADDPLAGWTTEELRAEIAKADDGRPAVPIDQAFARIRQELERRIAARTVGA